MEYWLTETALLASLIDNDYSEYTCSTLDNPFLACLDIAAPATLAGTINSSYVVNDAADLLQSVTQTYINADASSTNLFGVNQLCGGKVRGDGILDVLDLSVLTWIIFRVSPYQDVTGNTYTVNGETDVGGRCIDNITRVEWLSEYDVSDPCTIPTNLPLLPDGSYGNGRRMQETEDELDARIHLHNVMERGSWFHIRLNDTLIAVEILLDGIDSRHEVSLKNLKAPFSNDAESHVPFDDTALEVRYARHMEYISGGEDMVADCAVIRGMVASAALFRSTVGIGQIPTVQEGVDGVLLCPFDLFLYVPDVYDCSVDIRVGSRAMDGRSGQKMRSKASCDPRPFQFDGYNGLSPVHPPPPSSPPVAEETRGQTVLTVVIVVLVAIFCCCCVVATLFLLRRRQTRESGSGIVLVTGKDNQQRRNTPDVRPRARTAPIRPIRPPVRTATASATTIRPQQARRPAPQLPSRPKSLQELQSSQNASRNQALMRARMAAQQRRSGTAGSSGNTNRV